MALREETVHGWPCNFYANDVVKVGTKAGRFTLKVPVNEMSWFATRLRAELIKQELTLADDLPIDEAGEVAMRAKMEAAAQEAVKKTALRKTIADAASSPRRKAAAALEAAERQAMLAEQKRKLCEGEHRLVNLNAKMAKAAPLVSQLAGVVPGAEALQTKMEWFMVWQRLEPKLPNAAHMRTLLRFEPLTLCACDVRA